MFTTLKNVNMILNKHYIVFVFMDSGEEGACCLQMSVFLGKDLQRALEGFTVEYEAN